MFIVNDTGLNTIYYVSRYSEIMKYEIIDHQSNAIFSGETYLIGYNGKINHSGITYDFIKDNLYTYKSYYKDDFDIYYLSNQTLVRCFDDDTRLQNFTIKENINTFKNKI